MRKRIEISYLTFLGLSLTVVITGCKDRSTEFPFFSISTVVDNGLEVLESNDLVGFLKANQKESDTYIIEDNYFSHKVLHQTTQLLVDVTHRLCTISNVSQELSGFYPERLVGLLSLILYKFDLFALTYTYQSKDTFLPSTDLFTTYLVRAGPQSL